MQVDIWMWQPLLPTKVICMNMMASKAAIISFNQHGKHTFSVSISPKFAINTARLGIVRESINQKGYWD
jgi:hypothetical protein